MAISRRSGHTQVWRYAVLLRWRAEVFFSRWGLDRPGRRKWRRHVVPVATPLSAALTLSGQDMYVGASDGTVLFRPLGLDRTLVTLRLEVEPDGPIEALGAPDGFLERQVGANLRRFKDLVEEQLVPPGPWRGAVDPGGTIHGTT